MHIKNKIRRRSFVYLIKKYYCFFCSKMFGARWVAIAVACLAVVGADEASDPEGLLDAAGKQILKTVCSKIQLKKTNNQKNNLKSYTTVTKRRKPRFFICLFFPLVVQKRYLLIRCVNLTKYYANCFFFFFLRPKIGDEIQGVRLKQLQLNVSIDKNNCVKIAPRNVIPIPKYQYFMNS